MDLEVAKKEFLKYVGNYDETNPHIKRKRDHSLRVMQISEAIATNLGLEKEEVELATLIGLLHDIARFEQATVYKTFKDSKSIDHGDFGVKILTENNFIRKFIKEEKYDDIIKIAIKNHNKFEIEDGLDDTQLLFSKIVRDADKIDILYQGTYLSQLDIIHDIEKEKLSPEEIISFKEKRTVNREKDLKHTGSIKQVLVQLGFPFGIYFKESFTLLKDLNYIDKIIDRFNFEDKQTKELMEEVRNILNNYIDIKG